MTDQTAPKPEEKPVTEQAQAEVKAATERTVQRNPKEVLKQLTKYADGITVFSCVQVVTFALAVGDKGNLASNIQHSRPLAYFLIAIAAAIYLGLLTLCHLSENLLTDDPKGSPIAKATNRIRFARYVIVIFATVLLPSALVYSTRIGPANPTSQNTVCCQPCPTVPAR